ncbi:MAG: signal recognition particle-docking protein FtsY [Desulfuromonadales bacterium]
MDFEKYLQPIAAFLIDAGVPAQHGLMAALGLVYLGLTLLSLLIVIVVLRKNLRSRQGKEAPPAEEPVAEEPAVEEPKVEEPKVEEPKVEEPKVEEPKVEEPVSLFQRLRTGLAKTRGSLLGRVDALLGGRDRLDEAFLEELEEILITADFGMQATQTLIQSLADRLKECDLGEPAQLHRILGEEIRKRLKDAPPEWPAPAEGPLVIMVVGVNGVGKTTTIGKMAKQFADQGKRVVLGAGDTFRAAAAEQLEAWGERSGAEVVRHTEGSDPGAVAFDAVKAALARKADVLILDTAGRLHTKANLMEELKKVRRVIGREIPGAPHETLLVLDATTGQNALIQARIFQEAVAVSGIALTKLDGTAKGGIVVAICSQLDLPVRLIGVGEGVTDLRPFDADEFAAALFAND